MTSCDLCGLTDPEPGVVEFTRVQDSSGAWRLACDTCLETQGPFATYEVFLDEVPWITRLVASKMPGGTEARPETHFVDASSIVHVGFAIGPAAAPASASPVRLPTRPAVSPSAPRPNPAARTTSVATPRR